MREKKTGIVALDMDGWTLSVRTFGEGYEVSITDDRMESKYMRLDSEQSETLRRFFKEIP